jgi:hypothetical protein
MIPRTEPQLYVCEHLMYQWNSYDEEHPCGFVRKYKHPAPEKGNLIRCFDCEASLFKHGWADTAVGLKKVCPGDYIAILTNNRCAVVKEPFLEFSKKRFAG